jgi:hypothetical protein
MHVRDLSNMHLISQGLSCRGGSPSVDRRRIICQAARLAQRVDVVSRTPTWVMTTTTTRLPLNRRNWAPLSSQSRTGGDKPPTLTREVGWGGAQQRRQLHGSSPFAAPPGSQSRACVLSTLELCSSVVFLTCVGGLSYSVVVDSRPHVTCMWLSPNQPSRCQCEC